MCYGRKDRNTSIEREIPENSQSVATNERRDSLSSI